MTPHATGTREPAVTGMGVVSALGSGCLSLRQALDDGRDGIAPITRFSTEELTVHLGAMVAGADGGPADDSHEASRRLCVGFALQAAHEAWVEARVDDAGLAPDRIALVLGTSIGGHVGSLHGITEEVGKRLGVGGARLTVSTACSSSANALDLARCLLERGEADLVVAGGADVLTAEVFAGFHALGLLSQEKCAPWGEPFGTTLGEGAGFLVLESEAQAQRRGVRPRAFLHGFGLSSDAYHATSPDPTGAGVARAVRAALDDAGLSPEAIGYVNAHGTGTLANDIAEWKAIRTVFGPRAETLPVSATKSYLGHAQGAAGVLEIVATILCMERGLVPPTLRHTRARPFSPPDPVAGNRPRTLAYDHAVCTSSAFGGANAVVAIGCRARGLPARERRPVYVLGSGWVTSAGVGTGDVRGFGAASGPVPGFDLQALVPTLDPRGLDPASRFLIAAAARALDDAGLVVRGALRERAGLFVGAVTASAASSAEFRRSIEDRGLAQLSATAFTRLVLNAAAGACCQALALRAPTTTVSIGPGSGLLALLYAAELLSTERSADVLVAGGFDEPDASATAHGEAEGAACIVLAGTSQRRSVRAAGWAIGAPGRFAATAALALGRAAVSGRDVEAAYLDDPARTAWPAAAGVSSWRGPCAPAAEPLFATAAAFDALQAGKARVALVGTGGGDCASLALVLTVDDEPRDTAC